MGILFMLLLAKRKSTAREWFSGGVVIFPDHGGIFVAHCDNVSVNSKRDPYSFPNSGEFDANRSPDDLAFDRRQNIGQRSRLKRMHADEPTDAMTWQ